MRNKDDKVSNKPGYRKGKVEIDLEKEGLYACVMVQISFLVIPKHTGSERKPLRHPMISCLAFEKKNWTADWNRLH